MEPVSAHFRGLSVRSDFDEPWLRRFGRTVALTPREYGIFELLFKRHPRPASMTEIIAHLYPGTWQEAGPATIASYICHLRRKVSGVWLAIENHHAGRFSLRDDLTPQHAPCPHCQGAGIVLERVAA